MSNTILLTIVFLKTSLQRMQSKYYENAEKKKKLRRTLYLLLFLYIAGMIGFFSSKIIDSLAEVDQETSFIGLILFLTLMVNVVQVIFSSINILYFTKDTESILPLPLKPYEIILARTNVILIIQYLIEVVVGLIPLIVYGFKMNLGTMFYVPVLISLILLPILPTIIISLLVMFIMSFSKKAKNKNRFQLFTTLLVLAATIAFCIVMTKVDEQSISDEQMIQMMTKADGMIEIIKGYFPTLKYCINAILSNNIVTMIIEFAKTLGISLVAYAIYTILSQKLYFKGLVGSLFSGDNRKHKKKLKINSKSKSLGRRYIGKEFKTLLRDPVYLVQCILPAILLPILLIITLVMGIDKETINELLEYLDKINGNGMLLLGILGIIEFFSMIIYISITAISRDGKNAVFMKYIPVSLYKQYVYKTIPNIIMNFITIVIVLGVAKYLVDVSILNLIVLFIVAMIMNIAQSFILLIVDLKRPKLQWNSEYAVVKQNFNLIFPMILGLFGIGILFLYAKTTQIMSMYIVLGMIAVIYLLIAVLVNIYLYKKQYQLAGKIE